jgi:hypothetical protein
MNINIPDEYRAYAGSAEEAAEIVKIVEAANYPGAAKARQLPYAPELWSICLVPLELVGKVA